jgi:4-hydroxy-3-polyprenylbenzoate decarboxylase
LNLLRDLSGKGLVSEYSISLCEKNIPVLIVAVNLAEDSEIVKKIKDIFRTDNSYSVFKLILAIDHTVDPDDLFIVTWQILGNSDPKRDHDFIYPSTLFIDGTIKAFRKGGFPRKWPNVVCSDIETISAVDKKWELLDIGPFIQSPSKKIHGLCRPGKDEVKTD